MTLTEITYEDHERLKPFFVRQPHRLCAYSLPSLIAWSTGAYHPLAGLVGDALVTGAEFTVKKEHRHLLLPLGGAAGQSRAAAGDLHGTAGHVRGR